MENKIKIRSEFRELISRPLGSLIRSEKPSITELKLQLKGIQKLISVGDATTENLIKAGIIPLIQIIDRKEKRIPRENEIEGLSQKKRIVKNPAGFVTFEAISAISEGFHGNEPILVDVEGEEDLLALASIALSPIGGAVAYGQPDEGMVVVRVDIETRLKASNMLRDSGLPKHLLKY